MQCITAAVKCWICFRFHESDFSSQRGRSVSLSLNNFFWTSATCVFYIIEFPVLGYIITYLLYSGYKGIYHLVYSHFSFRLETWYFGRCALVVYCAKIWAQSDYSMWELQNRPFSVFCNVFCQFCYEPRDFDSFIISLFIIKAVFSYCTRRVILPCLGLVPSALML